MYLVSVMPIENDKAIPEPLERGKMLLESYKYAPQIDALYEAVLGIQRPPAPIGSLKEARAAVAQRGVRL